AAGCQGGQGAGRAGPRGGLLRAGRVCASGVRVRATRSGPGERPGLRRDRGVVGLHVRSVRVQAWRPYLVEAGGRVSIRVKINSAGAEALLKDPKVLADLRRRARAIAKAAGGSSVGEVGEERSRAAAIGDPDKLVRALDEGRR